MKSPSVFSPKNQNQPQSAAHSIEVYFDGLCHLCAREIDHYKSRKGSEKILFVDITEEDFSAERLGLDPYEVNKYLHVRTQSGEWITGVDSFIRIWQTLPGYSWLAKVVSFKPLYRLAQWGYEVFAAIRPYLPKKIRSCETSPYCEIPTRKESP
jgi:predicted DCC family thiol-disulfide oxidoreductase YuxK